MIDKEILDSVLPVPELEELKESTIKELEEEGFVITNFHSGGVFYTLLMIVLRIKIEFTELLRKVLSNMSVTHASGAWLDLKVADYGKKRKKAQKTRGLVTLSRASLQGEAVKIPKGHVFQNAQGHQRRRASVLRPRSGSSAKGSAVGRCAGRSRERRCEV